MGPVAEGLVRGGSTSAKEKRTVSGNLDLVSFVVLEARISVDPERSILIHGNYCIGHVSLPDKVQSLPLGHPTQQAYGFGVEEGRGGAYSILVPNPVSLGSEKEAAR